MRVEKEEKPFLGAYIGNFECSYSFSWRFNNMGIITNR